jgi:serine/threonine protein kinase
VELEKLLISLLTEADVRRLVHLLPGGENMHAELPGAGVSLTALVHQAVSVLERHGRLDGEFFEVLVAERPARRDEIRALAARMLGSAPPVPPDEREWSYTRHRLGQILPEADAALMSEITAVTRVIPAVRVPAHKNQQRPSAPNADPLAQALDDALARKQRLEAASLPVEEVLAEIRTLKRELRRGGILRPGDVLGHHYLLVEQLGQGGFATVWRARDQRIGADVAVKVLHPNLAGDLERRQRFFRGAHIMAELAHPAVVRIRVRKAQDDGFYYFIMDFVAGCNLHNAVLGQRLQYEQIKSIILHVGAALAAAHTRGIVHRDVKPSNILLDYKGQPYLTDFDLVTAPDTTGGTRTGAMGTFLYAPPEMLERPQEANARADVYGLGMTMAFMLHGEPLPHFAVREGSRFVRSLKCAAQLQSVLERAVAWKPEHRFADAGAFCQALREARAARSERRMTDLTSAQNQGHTEAQMLQWPSQFALRELLQNIRGGFPTNYPILIAGHGARPVAGNTRDQKWEVGAGSSGSTARPVNNSMHQPWLEYLFENYADHDIVLLKPKQPVPLPILTITIGRSRNCDITIRHDLVSKSHAQMRLNNSTSEYSLMDEGSRNGTFVNGDLIPPHEHQHLWDGVMLFFGEVAFIFVTPSTLRELAGIAPWLR